MKNEWRRKIEKEKVEDWRGEGGRLMGRRQKIDGERAEDWKGTGRKIKGDGLKNNLNLEAERTDGMI